MNHTVRMLVAMSGAAFSISAVAQDMSIDPASIKSPPAEYSPYLQHHYPDRAYFGDTHVHTSYSTDAGFFGNRLGPDEAYRFAKGEEVTASSGVRTRLLRPLDFLVIADHSENLGLAPMADESNPDLLKTEFDREIHGLVKAGNFGEAYALWGAGISTGDDPLLGQDALTRSMWERLTTSAEQHNDPGSFTALIGYEWTSSPGGNNLHRNVIFRDARTKRIESYRCLITIVPILRICGNGWPTMKIIRAARYSRLHTTVIFPTA